jgi:carbon monoxide dehydrogenase subunit G
MAMTGEVLLPADRSRVWATHNDAAGGAAPKYDVAADGGGKTAQLGWRLVDGVATKVADRFFIRSAVAAAAPAAL